MIKTEWNEASYAAVRVTTVEELVEAGGYGIDHLEFDGVEYPDDSEGHRVLVIEGDGGLAYIITGDLDAFARKVVEAVHGD